VGDYVGDDSRKPKLKTIAPLGAWRRMHEISPSRGFFDLMIGHVPTSGRPFFPDSSSKKTGKKHEEDEIKMM